MTELFASRTGTEITDLSGIEYLINLEELSLSDNRIIDISLLKKLTRLRVINV
jgi:Leucine-rich repeat (LRR) protein